MKANDIKKIAGQEWGHYKIFGKTIKQDGEIITATTPFRFYKDSTLVSTFAPSTPLVLNEIGTAKDYYQNNNGKVNRAIGNVDLGSLNWDKETTGYGVGYRFKSNVINNIKLVSSGVIANIKCNKYEAVTAGQTFLGQKTGIAVDLIGNLDIYDESYSDVQTFKNDLSGVISHYELASPTTEQANSVLLPKGITKVIDANGLELEFEILNDPLNFSNKIVQGKNAPIITAEKIITKGFTSGGEHFTQLYIYGDGEVWYVDGASSAQAFVQGVGWELEYKQLQFDSGVKLTTSERNALLNIYDLI